MPTWTAESKGSPAKAWNLIARPHAWPEWAPHLQGAWGLGDAEVRSGDIGAARLLGVVPVLVRITAVDRPRSWSWRVGELVRMDHRVEPSGSGCVLAIDLRAPAPLEAALARAYGPVIVKSLRRLARVIES